MSEDTESFEPKYRIDEEYEYYTELATNASQLWIEVNFFNISFDTHYDIFFSIGSFEEKAAKSR